MPDVISSGSEGGRGRWVAGVAALVVALGVLVYVEHRGPSSRAPAAGAPSPTPTVRHHMVSLGLYTTGSLEPDGETLTRIDLGTGRHTAVSGVPARSRTKLFVLPVRGGALVTAGSHGYLVEGARTVRTFPIGGQALPDATETTVWTHNRGRIRRIDLAGRPLTGWIVLPAGTSLLRGTRRGLLLAAGERTELWDPATGQVRGRYGRYLAATATRLAWAPQTCWSCAPRVTDLATGATRALTLRRAVPDYPIAFSPDGRWLAMEAGPADSRTRRAYLVDARTGRARLVPDTEPERGSQTSFTFSADSRWLILISMIDNALPPHSWVSLWRPGNDHPQVVARDDFNDEFVAVTG